MPEKTIVASVRLTPQHYRKLRRAAVRDQRTVSDFIRITLMSALSTKPTRSPRR